MELLIPYDCPVTSYHSPFKVRRNDFSLSELTRCYGEAHTSSPSGNPKWIFKVGEDLRMSFAEEQQVLPLPVSIATIEHNLEHKTTLWSGDHPLLRHFIYAHIVENQRGGIVDLEELLKECEVEDQAAVFSHVLEMSEPTLYREKYFLARSRN